jgi:hypothetical protein
MAVELAKLSLWLHTFTVGAPLSFLDHHLRTGDSLFGEWVRDAQDFLHARRAMMTSALITAARQSVSLMTSIERMSDADIQEVHASAESFSALEEATAPLNAMLSFVHAWRWLGSRDRAESALFNRLVDGSEGEPDRIAMGLVEPRSEEARALAARLRQIAADEHFLHWQVAFPNRWDDWTSAEPPGGFDAVIGNPPWDRIKLQQVEWFAARVPEIATHQRAADRKRSVERLVREGGEMADAYGRAAWRAEAQARVARSSYSQLGGGDTNLYSLFVERASRLVKPNGMVGLLTPSGIASDLGAAKFFRSVSTTGRLAGLFDFENRARGGGNLWFADVDSRFKFSALVFGGAERRFTETRVGFFLPGASDADLQHSTFTLSADDFARANPNTGTAPIFRSPRDAEITLGIYERLPVFVDRRSDPPEQPWPVRYVRMFDMTNDSHLFRTRAELELADCFPVAGNRWRGNVEGQTVEYVPLYVGRMLWQFDHRAAHVSATDALQNPFASDQTGPVEKADPSFAVQPQFWVDWNEVTPRRKWTLAFRDIARPTDARTIISALLPGAAYANTAALLLLDSAEHASILAGNLNSYALDYVARSKLQSAHANWYIVEQLPVVPPSAYGRRFGSKTAAEIVRDDVLALTYTAHDMEPFARDLGYDGPPFRWNDDDRRNRRARLDALYFHLYGIEREDADYILSTFPIVERQDRATHGRYLTRDLILAWMNALAAGEPDAEIVLPPV